MYTLIEHQQHTSDLSWEWLHLDEMPPALLYRLLAFRLSIFVVDLDGRDELAWHLLGQRSGHVLACLRVLLPPAGSKRYRIGRVAVDEAAHGETTAARLSGLVCSDNSGIN